MKQALITLYLLGAFVSGGYYRDSASRNCVSKIYLRTAALAAVWPLFGTMVVALGGTEDNCKK